MPEPPAAPKKVLRPDGDLGLEPAVILASTVATILSGAGRAHRQRHLPGLDKLVALAGRDPLTVNVGCATFGAISVVLPGTGRTPSG